MHEQCPTLSRRHSLNSYDNISAALCAIRAAKGAHLGFGPMRKRLQHRQPICPDHDRLAAPDLGHQAAAHDAGDADTALARRRQSAAGDLRLGVSPKLEVAVKGSRPLQLCLVESCPAAMGRTAGSAFQLNARQQPCDGSSGSCSRCWGSHAALPEAVRCSRRTLLEAQQAVVSI